MAVHDPRFASLVLEEIHSGLQAMDDSGRVAAWNEGGSLALRSPASRAAS